MRECPVCTRCYSDSVTECPADQAKPMFVIPGEPLLKERYQLRRRIGAGGMGKVYKAQHTFLKTEHAIKIILPQLVGNDPQLVTRFRQEAIATAAIRHQNIVTVTDFDVINGEIPFIVMEYVKGKSLDQIILNEGAVPLPRAVEIMEAACSGVSAAHRLGIVHRDLKPLNILLQEDLPISEGLKILDFGLAKIKGGDMFGSLVVAQTVGLMGSPYYMAPEQWSEEEPDARTDIYCLGIIFYQMLTGEVPFRGPSLAAIMRQHMMNEPPSFDDFRRFNIPLPIEDVVRRALMKDREDRPQTIEEFVGEIRRGLSSVQADLSITQVMQVIAGEPAPPPFSASQPEIDPAAATVYEPQNAASQAARAEHEAAKQSYEEMRKSYEAARSRLERAEGDFQSYPPSGSDDLTRAQMPTEVFQYTPPSVPTPLPPTRTSSGMPSQTPPPAPPTYNAPSSQANTASDEFALDPEETHPRQTRPDLPRPGVSLVAGGVESYPPDSFPPVAVSQAQVPLQSSLSASQQGKMSFSQSVAEIPAKSRAGLMAVAGAILGVLLLGGGFMLYRSLSGGTENANAETAKKVVAPTAAIQYYVEQQNGQQVSGADGANLKDGYYLHFIPQKDGYLYIVSGTATKSMSSLMTAKPCAVSGFSTNRVTAGSDIKFPDKVPLLLPPGSDQFAPFTVIFSEQPLTTPAFLADADCGKTLNSNEIAALEQFRRELLPRGGVAQTKKDGGGARVNIIPGANASSDAAEANVVMADFSVTAR